MATRGESVWVMVLLRGGRTTKELKWLYMFCCVPQGHRQGLHGAPLKDI